MNSRLLLTLALTATTSLTTAALAQSPARHKRYYNHQARPYYRGPVRLTLGGGATYYNGDLTGSLADNFIGPAISAGAIYKLYPSLQVGAEFTYFKLGAKDRLSSRGLAFQSQNAMLLAQARFNFLRDPADYADGSGIPLTLKPYVRFGLGALLYSPASYTGTERPTSSTDVGPAERNDYPATAFVAPLGVGLTVRVSRRVGVSAEGTYFFTSSDHLDDVSQRGNPGRNDGYGLLELKAEYALWP